MSENTSVLPRLVVGHRHHHCFVVVAHLIYDASSTPQEAKTDIIYGPVCVCVYHTDCFLLAHSAWTVVTNCRILQCCSPGLEHPLSRVPSASPSSVAGAIDYRYQELGHLLLALLLMLVIVSVFRCVYVGMHMCVCCMHVCICVFSSMCVTCLPHNPPK